MIRPFGTPPSPSARSRLKEPVGTVSTSIFARFSPSFITEPLPYCFSICAIAASSAFILSVLSNLSNLSALSVLFAIYPFSLSAALLEHLFVLCLSYTIFVFMSMIISPIFLRVNHILPTLTPRIRHRRLQQYSLQKKKL